MAFTPSEVEEIQAAIREVATRPCPVCGAPDAFHASRDGFVMLRLQENATGLLDGDPTLPCVATTCLKCGNTGLFNAKVLGLGHVVERYFENEPAPAG